MFYQVGENHFQRESVKWIVGLLAIHVYTQPGSAQWVAHLNSAQHQHSYIFPHITTGLAIAIGRLPQSFIGIELFSFSVTFRAEPDTLVLKSNQSFFVKGAYRLLIRFLANAEQGINSFRGALICYGNEPALFF